MRYFYIVVNSVKCQLGQTIETTRTRVIKCESIAKLINTYADSNMYIKFFHEITEEEYNKILERE